MDTNRSKAVRNQIEEEARKLRRIKNPTEWTAWLERCRLAARQGTIPPGFLSACEQCYVDAMYKLDQEPML